MRHENKLNPVLARWVTNLLAQLLSVYAIVQGVFAIVGDPERWSASTFEILLRVPGSPATWGVVIASAGVLSLAGTIFGKLRLVTIGMFISSVWSTFFAIGFLAAILTDDDKLTLTPLFSHFTFALVFALIGVVYRESNKLE